MAKILVVDDEEIMRFVFSEKLKEQGFSVVEAYDGLHALDIFQQEEFDAVLLDLKMPHMDGLQTMKELRGLNPDIPIIMVTAYGDIPTAVQAIKLGAYDFVEKPPQISRIIVTLKRAIEKLELERRIKNLDATVENSLEWLLGKSPAMKSVIKQIQQVARSDFSIIIQGETGTGKSFVANAIHNLSKRAGKHFIKVDFGVIPESLIESELFGHEKGAFTGAERKRKGYFELAHEGTIFIDELQNISAFTQSKLLSVVEERKIFPIGRIEPVKIDVRIIAATNREIRKSIMENQLREDLFFRLGEFIITLPPLKERIGDIPFFANKFLIEAAMELNKQMREIDDEALDNLKHYSWPGNIRELKNVMRRAVLLSDDSVVRKSEIKFSIEHNFEEKESGALFPLKDAIMSVERKTIREALILSNGNKTKAASLLSIDYKTLLSKIKEYNLP